ncbi:uncharacterized protein [Henckelia pumila]|uniref:uncharacterized protein n=1 Tax=Henckelia pumila TaxID=405737 RepID=UPI003C6E60E2
MCSGIVAMRHQSDMISITDFEGVGDEWTSNTNSSKEEIYRIKNLRGRGGTFLYIPRGGISRDLFNLTSRITLYLARGAVIKATPSFAGVLTVQMICLLWSKIFVGFVLNKLFSEPWQSNISSTLVFLQDMSSIPKEKIIQVNLTNQNPANPLEVNIYNIFVSGSTNLKGTY